MDLERLSALDLRTNKKSNVKSTKPKRKRSQPRKSIPKSNPFPPKSQQLDLFDIVDLERRPMERTTSLPNISRLESIEKLVRRGSFSIKENDESDKTIRK